MLVPVGEDVVREGTSFHCPDWISIGRCAKSRAWPRAPGTVHGGGSRPSTPSRFRSTTKLPRPRCHLSPAPKRPHPQASPVPPATVWPRLRLAPSPPLYWAPRQPGPAPVQAPPLAPSVGPPQFRKHSLPRPPPGPYHSPHGGEECPWRSRNSVQAEPSVASVSQARAELSTGGGF